MSSRPSGSESSGYWYGSDETRLGSVDVLNLLRRYRSADQEMRRRTRDSMGMGETDLVALRYVLRAEREGEMLTPGALAKLLGISTASTTVLIDRLERSGHLVRRPHPTDRRSLVVASTTDSDEEVRATLGRMHRAMIEVADGLDQDELAVVARLLAGMIEALELVDPHAEAEEADGESTAAVAPADDDAARHRDGAGGESS
ncbi:MarR family winged helix-turn-helix transcriptional regulator [Agromyces binzhouensis]|uniref:MarR family transcriptional regulator n=1 Tax=Agromyces binzhouensis TaxID=1817495 RepID=A0A4Q2JQN0_9MICO|nr:MarR family transcriptional regulator [Agromyces binzhouensis]RXZ48348.1 MarR family transcriptional regulator [Agromyces binzhouensis]